MALRRAAMLALLVGLYLVLAAYLYVRQRSFIYFPNTVRPTVSNVSVAGLREVALDAPDGLRLLAWYVPPSKNKPVVLYFHGNGGTIADRADRLVTFARAGYGVLMPEYRGYGGNPGTPSETAFFSDAEAAMDFLEREGTAESSVVVYGESLGTGVAVSVASRHQVRALVLDAPFTSVAAIAAEQFFFLPVKWMLKDHFDSLSRIGDVRAPLLVIQGARDRVISPALGRHLFDSANEPKELRTDPEGNHSDLLERGAIKTVLDFLEKHAPQS